MAQEKWCVIGVTAQEAKTVLNVVPEKHVVTNVMERETSNAKNVVEMLPLPVRTVMGKGKSDTILKCETLRFRSVDPKMLSSELFL
jgi:hypothetical protein